MDIITANSNPRVKELVKLNRDAGLRKQRDVFVVEGIRMFRELPADMVKDIYMSESAYSQYGGEPFMEELPASVRVSVLSDSVFKTVSQTKSPQGLLAVVKCFHHSIDELAGKNEKETFLVLDAVQDPGNMGTIIRSAEAAGVTAVIIGEGSCNPYNPKVVRSTMGTIFRVPFIVCGSGDGQDEAPGLSEVIGCLKRRGVVIYGAHLDGDALYETRFPDRTAFLIGNEGNGLSREIASTADRLLRIPMEGGVESLNAAVSAAILSYEVLRQRKYDRQN